MIAEQFDFRLCKVMRARKMRTTDLAMRVSMPASVLSRLRAGHTKPTFSTLCKLAKELDISIDWLVGFTDDMRPLTIDKDKP
ncbi:helix-turn-helix domain-containing protein [Paraburkholderia sp. SIMBA_030]|uniref:helix-turn-helix domain-containing protein n=1 Tax=Paraburkholderia sp. SIMBA_030 TaxID=3085773 RepID=UPI00397E5268